MNELKRLDRSQLLQNVGLHGGRCGGRQRHHRRGPQRWQVLPDHPVVRPEVVSPLRDAVCLVDGDQRGLALGQHLAEARHPQTLGRNEEELQVSLQIVHACLPRLRPVQAGVNPPHAEAQRRQLGSLVFHQRNQRADDQRRSSQRNRRQLIAQRLAKAGRHHQQQVAPRNRRAANRLLIRPEAGKSKDRAQQFCQFVRIGGSRQKKKARCIYRISEEVDVLKGHDFSRAVSDAKSAWALAPEGMLNEEWNSIRGSLMKSGEEHKFPLTTL